MLPGSRDVLLKNLRNVMRATHLAGICREILFFSGAFTLDIWCICWWLLKSCNAWWSRGNIQASTTGFEQAAVSTFPISSHHLRSWLESSPSLQRVKNSGIRKLWKHETSHTLSRLWMSVEAFLQPKWEKLHCWCRKIKARWWSTTMGCKCSCSLKVGHHSHVCPIFSPCFTCCAWKKATQSIRERPREEWKSSPEDGDQMKKTDKHD